jgi:general secretion pathway protein G
MSDRRYQTRRAAQVVRNDQKPMSVFDVNRGDGIVSRAASHDVRPLEGGVRRPFTGVSRGDGLTSRAAARSAQRGFSLMEIIIVTILIGGIVAFAARQVLGGGDRANYRIAEAQIQTLAQKIDQYEMDTGRLPNALQDLVVQPGNAPGWLGPYARNDDLVDPWKTPIEYRVPGDGRRFDLISLGADRAPGGQSVNADIRFE